MIYEIRKVRFASAMQELESSESVLSGEHDSKYRAFLNSESKDVMIISTNEKFKKKIMTSLAAIKSYTIVAKAKIQDWEIFVENIFFGVPIPREKDAPKRASKEAKTPKSKGTGATVTLKKPN